MDLPRVTQQPGPFQRAMSRGKRARSGHRPPSGLLGVRGGASPGQGLLKSLGQKTPGHSRGEGDEQVQGSEGACRTWLSTSACTLPVLALPTARAWRAWLRGAAVGLPVCTSPCSRPVSATSVFYGGPSSSPWTCRRLVPREGLGRLRLPSPTGAVPPAHCLPRGPQGTGPTHQPHLSALFTLLPGSVNSSVHLYNEFPDLFLPK